MGNPLAIALGPGILYGAATGSPEPTDLSAAWAAAWFQFGYTDAGSTVTLETTFEDVLVAEELDPVKIAATSRNNRVEFAAVEITATNLRRVNNGGTITAGTGCVIYDPPALGQEVRTMIGWQSDDAQERWVFRQCIQTGAVAIPRQKSPAKAMLPVVFRLEKPAGVQPYRVIEASPARA
jgi:hypothetical protein